MRPYGTSKNTKVHLFHAARSVAATGLPLALASGMGIFSRRALGNRYSYAFRFLILYILFCAIFTNFFRPNRSLSPLPVSLQFADALPLQLAAEGGFHPGEAL